MPSQEKPISEPRNRDEAAGDKSTSINRAFRRRGRSRQMRERTTAHIMIAFGLLLGGLELFIVLHYI